MKSLLVVSLLASIAAAQVARQANERYQTPEGREQVAALLNAPDRVARDKPEELVRTLAIAPGSTVADVGTGTGFLLPYLSSAVGPAGRVLAEDIHGDFLDDARAAAKKRGLQNVDFIEGTETDPKLPAGGVDLAITLDAYHHYNYPERMLAGLRKALRAGGRLAIADMYRKSAPAAAGPNHIRADRDQVIEEVERAGFRLLSKSDHIPGSIYLLLFEKK